MTAPDAHLVSGVRAAQISGLTYRQVDYLARSGVVVPTVGADGSGSQRGYGPEDIALLIVWRDLYNVMGRPKGGVPGARRIISEVREMRDVVPSIVVKKGAVRITVDVATARRIADKAFTGTTEKAGAA